MFGYARTCQDIYIESEDDEEIGRFKAESLSGFEEMTIKHPDIPEGHYYLGYAYVNMGLYLKAQIAWQEFIRLRMEQVRSGAGNQPDSSDQENDGNFRIPDDVTEIRSRLDQLEEPVKIEEGCNHIIAGRYDQGIEVLEKFADGPHSNWWPMHYYLGTAYRETGRLGEAAQSFRAVLQLNASHIDSMQELVEIYGLLGETELEQKYRNKMMLVREMQ
jgi:tetratricopeptide (TPR) repeat protein